MVQHIMRWIPPETATDVAFNMEEPPINVAALTAGQKKMKILWRPLGQSLDGVNSKHIRAIGISKHIWDKKSTGDKKDIVLVELSQLLGKFLPRVFVLKALTIMCNTSPN